ncbi:MAG TPA: MbnP family protein [Chryseolinea sp.]
MKNFYRTQTFMLTRALLISCILGLCILGKSIAQSSSKGKQVGAAELIITPFVGAKPLYLDSVYTNANGERYAVKKLKFFISDVALAKAVGEEVTARSAQSKAGIFLIDFKESNFDAGYGMQSYKIEFDVLEGEYSDIRFNVGLPRRVNHLDPSLAEPPLNIAQGDMYWAWNSGYIFLLVEGQRLEQNDFFHFAIGGDARIMPMYFGNLFNVKPLLQIKNKQTSRIFFKLDLNKIFEAEDGSKYSIKEEEAAVVHGGYRADALRNNFIKAIEFKSVKTSEK